MSVGAGSGWIFSRFSWAVQKEWGSRGVRAEFRHRNDPMADFMIGVNKYINRMQGQVDTGHLRVPTELLVRSGHRRGVFGWDPCFRRNKGWKQLFYF